MTKEKLHIYARLCAAIVLVCLLQLIRPPVADTQKQDELIEHLHVTWTAKCKATNSDIYQQSEETDGLTVELDVTAHGTAPAGTPPWAIHPTISATYAVSGGGTSSMTEKDEWSKGSWSYALKGNPSAPSEVMQIGSGSFQVSNFGFDDSIIDIQGQVQGGGKAGPTGPFPVLAGLCYPAGVGLIAGYANTKDFYDELSGTFDSNTRAFTKSGGAIRSFKLSGGITGTVHAQYSLNFNQQPEDVEAVLIAEPGYEDWMPKGGPTEDTAGNYVAARVELRKKGSKEKPAYTTVREFTFQLESTSQEPGVCLNWPPQDLTKSDPDFDLKIDPNQNHNFIVDPGGQKATIATQGSPRMVVLISSYDWGGWSNLTASVELSDGRFMEAHLEDKPGVRELSIPKDDNGNHIADVWEKNGDQLGATDDEDDFPGGDHTGDGLSYYEEYRGFHISSTGMPVPYVEGRTLDPDHVRTDPRRKDVFISDEGAVGLGDFPKSGMAIHVLQQNEFITTGVKNKETDNPYVVNFNHKSAHLGSNAPGGHESHDDVHVIKIIKGPTPQPGLIGQKVPNDASTPKHCVAVYVNVERGMESKFGKLELTNQIAHEIAHACSVPHHGDSDYFPTQIFSKGSNGRFFPMATKCGVLPDGAPAQCYVARKNDIKNPPDASKYSGAVNCIMRYYRLYGYYEAGNGQFAWTDAHNRYQQGELYGPTEPPGHEFCSSPDDPKNRLGSAMNGRGNCSQKFCVNDLKH